MSYRGPTMWQSNWPQGQKENLAGVSRPREASVSFQGEAVISHADCCPQDKETGGWEDPFNMGM